MIISRFTPHISGGYAQPRWYTRFNGTSWLQIPTATLSGNFEINVTIATTSTATENTILDSDSSVDTYFKLRTSAGIPEALLGNGSTWYEYDLGGGEAINDGSPHTVKIARSGYVTALYVDGELRESVVQAQIADVVIKYVGSQSGSLRYFLGHIYDLTIYDNGVLIRDYKLDEPYSPSLIYRDTIGSNDAQGYNITSDDVTQVLV